MKRLVPVVLTAFMAAPFPALAQSRELGTLFFTPDERSQLDRIRRGDPAGNAARRGEPIVNGFVKRSDGQGTIWIDGREIDVTSQKATATLQPGIVGSLNEAIDIQVHDDSQEPEKTTARKLSSRRHDSGTPPVLQKSK
jgi:hypothetical protein